MLAYRFGLPRRIVDLQSAVVKCGLDNDSETLDQRITNPMLVSGDPSVG